MANNNDNPLKLSDALEADLEIWIHKRQVLTPDESIKLAEKIISGLYKEYTLIKLDFLINDSAIVKLKTKVAQLQSELDLIKLQSEKD